jgi:hypothetical protein
MYFCVSWAVQDSLLDAAAKNACLDMQHNQHDGHPLYWQCFGVFAYHATVFCVASFSPIALHQLYEINLHISLLVHVCAAKCEI